MVKVYALALVVGLIGLVTVIIANTIDIRRESPSRLSSVGGGVKATIGALTGFGMGGMSAEFSPLDLSWQVSLAIAALAALLSALWVRYSVGQGESG